MKTIAEIIVEKPRKPSSYDLRKNRGSERDIEIVEDYERQLSEWKANQKKMMNEIKQNTEISVLQEEKQVYRFEEGELIENFKRCYKEANNCDFKSKNPFSENEEPFLLIKTLFYYFLTDNRFFKSPLLSKISEPSFNKGLLIIGGFGCGKTSIFRAIKRLFNEYIKLIQSNDFSNEKYLMNCLRFDACTSTDVVLNYSNSKDTSYCQDIITNLIRPTPLYIDDILREDDAYNYGKRNIFKEVLSARADKNYKTYLTCNYLEIDEDGKTADTLESLNQFRKKYDGRIYDRLFQMFNIIELKGKSFRR